MQRESLSSSKFPLSWNAIFCAALIGVGLNFILNLMALAIGLSIFTINAEGKTVFSLFGFMNFSFVAIVAMFTTGFVAGLLSPPYFKKTWGILYGFSAWSLLLIFTVIIITNMIQFTAFHSNFTSKPNLVTIRISNDVPMFTESKDTSTKSGPVTVNIETTTKYITLNATATFLLFLIGALSSCAGGWIAYSKRIESFQRNGKSS